MYTRVLISVNNVNWHKINSKDPEIEKRRLQEEKDNERENISIIRNRKEIEKTYDEIDPTIRDFYNDYNPLEITESDKQDGIVKAFSRVEVLISQTG